MCFREYHRTIKIFRHGLDIAYGSINTFNLIDLKLLFPLVETGFGLSLFQGTTLKVESLYFEICDEIFILFTFISGIITSTSELN